MARKRTLSSDTLYQDTSPGHTGVGELEFIELYHLSHGHAPRKEKRLCMEGFQIDLQAKRSAKVQALL
jgi:hypothetical protein